MSFETGLEVATILSGSALSGEVHLHNQRLFGILMPAAWDAANLTFQASIDGSNFFEVYDDNGNEVTVTAAASRFIVLSAPLLYLGLQRIIIRSGTAASPVNQTANRTLNLIPLA